jgi:acetyl esterase/lipase
VVSALAACTERSEPYAQLGDVQPTAIVPFCGLLQTSDPARFRGRIPFYMQDVIDHTCEGYNPSPTPGSLADPLVEVEAAKSLPDWPRTFVPWGGSDPIGEDSARLVSALSRAGVDTQSQEYPGLPHALHAYIWRKGARRCWADVFEFLGR